MIQIYIQFRCCPQTLAARGHVTVVALGVAILLASAAFAQIPITTIVNPGFETGTPGQQVSAGWTQIPGLGPMFLATAGSPGLLPGDPNSAHSDSNFLSANRQLPEPDYPTNQNMGVMQDIDLTQYASEISLGGRQMNLSFAYNDNDPNDTAVAAYNFLDGVGSPIGNTYTFIAGSTGTGSWATTSLLGEIPIGAASMRLSLQTAFTGGTVRNISYDSVSAAILPPAPPAPPTGLVNGNLIQFDGDGNWTWYSDERAIVDPNNGHVLINSVGFAPSYVNNSQNIGLVDVVNFDPQTGRRVRTQISNLSGVASQNIQRDDHNVGSLLVLPDGRYLALYANHGNQGGLGDRWTRWRVSNNPGDSTSWSNEQVFDWYPTPGTDTNVSYHNLFYLSEEDQVYDISRANGEAPNVLRYNNDTNQLSWGGQLADSSTGGYSTGYFKYASNGVNRIYFTHTETHPRNFNTSIYSGYIENGQSLDMLGNVIDSNIFDNESAAGGSGFVPDVTQFSLVHQADPLGGGHNRLWTVDTNLDADGNPMALYISRWNPDGATSNGSTTNPIDHRLHFARWNDQTSQWQRHEIAKMGNRLYRGTDMSEQDYTGNAALVPGDPNTVYISTPYDPRDPTGTTFTNAYEIYKGVTADAGANWTWTAVTENSVVDNLRPIVPDSHGGDTTVIWFRGRYTTAQSIDAAVVGIVERRGEVQGLVGYVDANASNTMYASGAALQTSTPSGNTGALDNLWHQRTGFGNGGSLLTSSETGFENAPMLKTTIDGLADGLYDVFAYFWSDDDEDWRLMAGLENNNLVDFRRFGSQHAEADQFVTIETVSANNNDLLLYRVYLGRTDVMGGADIEVFIDDWQSLAGSAIRTWYDGLGYALVSAVPPPLDGDFNNDLVVDAADYVVWRDGLGTEYNQGHYELWRANFGRTAGAGSNTAGGTTVPEPTTATAFLMTAAIASLVLRKRV